jgi:hypothetical protein
MKTYKDLEKFFERLMKQREEMKLQLHLFKAEAKDQWTKAEKKWKQLKIRMEQLRLEAGAATRNPDKAIKNLAWEIKEKYKYIRQRL